MVALCPGNSSSPSSSTAFCWSPWRIESSAECLPPKSSVTLPVFSTTAPTSAGLSPEIPGTSKEVISAAGCALPKTFTLSRTEIAWIVSATALESSGRRLTVSEVT